MAVHFMDFSYLSNPHAWFSFATLLMMEVVLGVDNIVFISILVGKLPKHEHDRARILGILLALGFRILLLSGIAYLAHLTLPLFEIREFKITARDLLMAGGGLFLIAKATSEIHAKIQGIEKTPTVKRVGFWSVILQIIVLDAVFSLDAVLTAVGLVDELYIMIAAVIVSMLIMLAFSKRISRFVHGHATTQMLALSFLLLIGVLLFLEGFHIKVPKGYVYFAIAFSVFVEMMNIRFRKKQKSA